MSLTQVYLCSLIILSLTILLSNRVRCINWWAWLVCRLCCEVDEWSTSLGACFTAMQQVSKVFWTHVVGEILQVASEKENMRDKLAVALSSAKVGMVGHVPHECSLCFFLALLDIVFVLYPSLNHLPVDRKVFCSLPL